MKKYLISLLALLASFQVQAQNDGSLLWLGNQDGGSCQVTTDLANNPTINIAKKELEQAARLIEEDKINITQVAYSVGFNNQTHFSTIFKKHFGMSPSEYAETKRNEK